MAMATLNVRIPSDLKQRGMQVLDREGVSVSDAVRGTFEHIARTQEIPEYLKDEGTPNRNEIIARKRQLLRSMVGILPRELDAETAWRDHLEWKNRPGERL